jgi:phosphatidylethanolamine/phosphatidyl-N-methylethanolamine N-methyltransferase
MAKFWRQYLSNPKEIGFPVTCSKETASRMADAAEITEANAVVEFGPGTGVVTREILKRIPEDCKFFAIEINADLAAETRKRTGATVYVDSCANVMQYMQEHQMSTCDAIICTIPWALLGEEETEKILDEVEKALAPGSRFVTVGLSMGKNTAGGKRLREQLQQRFSKVKSSKKIWANFPPAFYYRCLK